MTKEFIPYELALELKELGFDEPCFVYWVFDGVEITFSTSHNKSGWSMNGFKNNQMAKKAGLCAAPLYQQAFQWFREKYELWQMVMQNTDIDWTYDILPINGIHDYKLIDVFETYEEAQQACLKKLIEIVKKK
jgi:hypothetical protein